MSNDDAVSRFTVLAALAAVGVLSIRAGADLGDQTFGPIDLEAATGSDGALGVQYLNGLYYVSSRLVPPQSNHQVYTFDEAGNPVGQFEQHPDAAPSQWGYRDGATDGTLIYFGMETGIYSHNPDGTNPQVFIPGMGPNGNYRALAYDATGDGGNGSFWTANFSSGLVEVDRSGNVLNTFPNLDGWAFFGLALDPDAPTRLWGYSSNMEIIEVDIEDGSATQGRTTGRRFTANPGAGLTQGGLTGVPGGAGGSGNAWDVVGVAQGDPDTLNGYEIRSDPVPRLWLDNQTAGLGPGNVPVAITNPIGAWLELAPNFGVMWETSMWVDSEPPPGGSGTLNRCDYLFAFPSSGGQNRWYHVETVTVTAYLDVLGNPNPPQAWQYFDYDRPPVGQPGAPIGTVDERWMEIHPLFGQFWNLAQWNDVNGNTIMDDGDSVVFESATTGQFIFREVTNVATDIELKEENPPGVGCTGDVNGDNVVDVLDLLEVLLAWGICPGCPADINGDGVVDVLDLLEVLLAWGPC